METYLREFFGEKSSLNLSIYFFLVLSKYFSFHLILTLLKGCFFNRVHELNFIFQLILIEFSVKLSFQ